MAKTKGNQPKKATKKAKNAEAGTPKKRNSAKKSKPKKKPNGIDLSDTPKAITAAAGLPVTGTTDRGTIALTERLIQPGSGFAQVSGVDLVAQLGLPIGDL